MKRSLFLTIAVFAVTLISSQLASGQWVVCEGNDIWRERYINVPSANFNVEFTVEVRAAGGYAEAGTNWTNNNGVYKSSNSVCRYPGCGRVSNIGTRNGNGVVVFEFCYTSGDAYAKAELWQW